MKIVLSQTLAVVIVASTELLNNGYGASRPIELHPENPHYFLWRGKPTILITSGEHYGAVLNLDFDYKKYLNTLAMDGLNNTRTFTGGAYVEPAGAFNIARNTLAPEKGRFICPWARSGEPGYVGGGNKFDLNRWDDKYFERLKDFVGLASKLGIVVEVNLFCPFYDESQWRLSPFNIINNVNNIGNVARTNVYTLDKHEGLLPYQEKMVRKIVEELKDFDNVYYEICNEPYFGGVTLEWQRHIADVIMDAQKNHRYKKLISQNIANHKAKITNPHPAVSIFNFHYAAPPDTVEMNYHLNKVIGDNETGFRGTNDAPYRTEAWEFIIAGGGLFNHLDYSFAVGHEDGSFVYPSTQPGGGNAGFRKQMRVLAGFINSFNFIKMRPDNSVIRGQLPNWMSVRALVDEGNAYAIYCRRSIAQQYSARWTGWVDPDKSGDYIINTISDDGVSLWIDNKLIIDDWTERGEKENSAKISLVEGKKYSIKLEYFFSGGNATMKLLWSSSENKKEVIPADVLLTPDGSEHGLKGEYFDGKGLKKSWFSRTDAQVNFSWGDISPIIKDKNEFKSLTVKIPDGKYSCQWVSPLDGKVLKNETINVNSGEYKFTVPDFDVDIALKISRR